MVNYRKILRDIIVKYNDAYMHGILAVQGSYGSEVIMKVVIIIIQRGSVAAIILDFEKLN